MYQIREKNIPQAYPEALWKISKFGKKEETRNGPVLALQEPCFLEIKEPTQRVLFDQDRKCNHFFHLMEFVWMMAGSRQTDWVSYFNSNMEKYSLKNVLYGAYGYRWRNHWGVDQLRKVVRTLQRDPTTRQAVLQMWDPVADLDTLNPDKPCNTTIYFRLVNDQLNMTVCNRSNDLIWGMLGANAVHMTLLHELIAAATNLPLGHYQVFTNNLHIYTELPNYEKLINTFAPDDPYSTKVMNHVPVLQPEESFEGFLRDCQMLLEGDYELENNWLRKVALPAHHAYRERKDKSETGLSYINSMPNCDWKLALQLWVASHF